MKNLNLSLITLALSTLLNPPHASAETLKKVPLICEFVGGISACVVDMSQATVNLRIHNSGRSYCGLVVMPDQSSLDSSVFANSIRFTVFLPEEDLLVKPQPGSVLIQDAGGELYPGSFVIFSRLSTKTGETFRQLADRTGAKGKQLLIYPQMCEE